MAGLLEQLRSENETLRTQIGDIAKLQNSKSPDHVKLESHVETVKEVAMEVPDREILTESRTYTQPTIGDFLQRPIAGLFDMSIEPTAPQELLCHISNTLPIDPVRLKGEKQYVYEKAILISTLVEGMSGLVEIEKAVKEDLEIQQWVVKNNKSSEAKDWILRKKGKMSKKEIIDFLGLDISMDMLSSKEPNFYLLPTNSEQTSINELNWDTLLKHFDPDESFFRNRKGMVSF